jgi:hypothetical protein
MIKEQIVMSGLAATEIKTNLPALKENIGMLNSQMKRLRNTSMISR